MSQAMHVEPPPPHALTVGEEMHAEPEQQPVGQLAAPQLEHEPAAQVLPPVHAVHVEPAEPHDTVVVPARHVVPSQHPAHEVPSQTHAPPAQCWPTVHAAPPPHVQVPVAEQPSERPSAAQSVQRPPAAPHEVGERDMQSLPAQHPVGHELASHTHAPPTHAWPALHETPAPHAHVPSAAHRSERRSHAAHATPPAPHALAVVEVTQLAPEQQPAHVTALQPAHTPPTHASVPGQVAHAAPPAPHPSVAVPGMHVVPLQQPPHEVPSQTHAPSTQCWPLPHAGPEPHRQVPLASQVSVRIGSHAAHATPPAPHAVIDDVLQLVPAQHPVHDVASHTQSPDEQR